MAKYTDAKIQVAKSLYLRHYTPAEIAEELNLPNRRIVYYWAQKWNWADMLSHETVIDAINRRITLLAGRDKKTELEKDELDRLIEHHVKLMAQANKHAEKLAALKAARQSEMQGSGESAFNDDGESKKKKKRYRKNDISNLTADDFQKFADEMLFGYQKHLRANITKSVRNILKSRQIGATWYFAFEAFEDACLTGKPQLFLSASKPQAEVFRSYIVNIAEKFFGVTLTGNPIRLSNGAELRFLSTNKNTAQSYSGHLYCDEYFWVPDFKRFNEVSSAMATHDHWRTTYFSTPSAKTHPAYPFWTGDEWRGSDPARKKVKFPQFDELRDGGRDCPDGQWRYVITLEDAIKGGFNLASIERLRNKYNPDSFNMLFMCVFVDSGASVFKYHQLDKCGVDVHLWEDHNPDAPRPFGDREVWGGFDPARSGDTSTFAIVAPPMMAPEVFRVLAIFYWQGMNWKHQAKLIEDLTKRYRFTYIGIDTTGIGHGVYEMVQDFAPRQTHSIHYSQQTKNQLVMKMIDVVSEERLEWDEEQKEILASFLSIRHTTTGKGGSMTFVADRTQETGHADAFWAIAHAVMNEPLNFERKRTSKYRFT
ncbi:terminase large subunit domain-containing protein [Providencia rustigianii]|uniref:ATPase subunit of terminase (GpP-like) n=1 Tax=Providencia rustigianii DSM 4541 TaxID=500637 RepID=D1NZP8_9GAMM|nr:terminase family protein [Providencia rustigianii]EFB73314.1 putative ATPase subunit of terminase (gpP-like) [Providencia rustigianii DSM 4541]